MDCFKCKMRDRKITHSMPKTALITGSNRGIGFETARQLGLRNFRIIISGRSESGLNEALQLLKSEEINAEVLLLDVSDQKSIEQAAAILTEKNIKPDILINNAGILLKEDQRLLENDFSILEKTIQTNCYGPVHVIRSFLPLMNTPGRIVNISSGGGSMTDPVEGWSPAYCVSKTMLNGFTRQLAYELRSKNISVNAVCPGWVRTRMGGKSAPRTIEKGAETQVWLASEAPKNLTGKFFRDKKVIPW